MPHAQQQIMIIPIFSSRYKSYDAIRSEIPAPKMCATLQLHAKMHSLIIHLHRFGGIHFHLSVPAFNTHFFNFLSLCESSSVCARMPLSFIFFSHFLCHSSGNRKVSKRRKYTQHQKPNIFIQMR